MAGYGPQYQSIEPQVQSEALPGRPWPHLEDEVSPAATGAPIGEGIENAGEVLARHAEAAENMARQTQAMGAENQLQALSLQLTHDPQNGAFTKQGQAAFGLSGQYMPQWNAGAQQIVDSVPDPRARLAVQQAAAHMGLGLTQQLDAHEIQQHQVFASRTAMDSVNIAEQASAANYNNPQILAANHDRIDAALTSISQTQGWSADQLTDAKQEAFSRLHGNVIDRMLTDGKVQMAAHYLDTVKGEMDPESAFRASEAIKTQVRATQDQARTEIAGRYEDSLAAATAGLQNPISVSRGEMDVLFPHDAQRRWDELQIMSRAGAQAKAYDHMSIDDIHADLQGQRPQGGPEALYQLNAFHALSAAAQKSITARKADSAAFLESRGDWKPLDFSNPQGALAQLRNRALTQSELSRQLGVPVNLFSKDETQTLTRALTTLSPRNRVALLGQLRNTLPNDAAYSSALNEIAGKSPVLGLVGQMVGTPKGTPPAWSDPRFGFDPQTAEYILHGEDILAQRGESKPGTTNTSALSSRGFNMPQDQSLSTYFWKQLGGTDSNVFSGRSFTSDAYFQAFKDAYASLAEERGVNSGAANDSIGKEAAQAVLGNHVRYNHSDLIAPAGMDPSRFEDIAHQGVIEAAEKAGVDAPMASALANSAGLHELGGLLGSGRYALIDGNGRRILVKGQPLIIDLAGVKPQAVAKPQADITAGEISRALTQAADQRIGEAP